MVESRGQTALFVEIETNQEAAVRRESNERILAKEEDCNA